MSKIEDNIWSWAPKPRTSPPAPTGNLGYYTSGGIVIAAEGEQGLYQEQPIVDARNDYVKHLVPLEAAGLTICGVNVPIPEERNPGAFLMPQDGIVYPSNLPVVSEMENMAYHLTHRNDSARGGEHCSY